MAGEIITSPTIDGQVVTLDYQEPHVVEPVIIVTDNAATSPSADVRHEQSKMANTGDELTLSFTTVKDVLMPKVVFFQDSAARVIGRGTSWEAKYKILGDEVG